MTSASASAGSTGSTGSTGGAVLDAAPVLLRVQHISKTFAGTRAVDDLSLEVHAGRILALLGENGAGKSTLIKMLAGVYRRDHGAIVFDGRDVDEPGGRAGISFIHQDLGLVEWMTVAENMALGYGFPRRRGLVDWAAAETHARRALDRVGGGIDPRARVFDLARTEKSLLAIARALALDARLLVLDEPTASLPEADVERLFAVLRSLRARGVAMIYVTHRLDEVFRLADDVAVLRNGRLVAVGPVADTTQRDVVHQIVGRAVERAARPRALAASTGVPRLALDGLCVGEVGPIDLHVRSGEIVGLVGLRGAGQAAVGRAVAGVEAVTAGRLLVDGVATPLRSTSDAVRAGISFSTSNREAEGLANGLSVRENLFVNPATWGQTLFRLRSRRRERSEARRIIKLLGVRPTDPEKIADTLSGGNQQKVILGRWLPLARPVLVLEEPTMGVDVGARTDIYRQVDGALGAGTAVMIVSTDFDEVAAVCHRAVVFNRGHIVAELVGDALTTAALVAAASGDDPATHDAQRADALHVGSS